MLQRCATAFRRLGYHGTTMDTLASACGLTKASFYHHYPNKESLLRDVLEWTHQAISQTLFAVAFDATLSPAQRLEKMGRKALRLFQGEATGCLMGVIAVDATYGKAELMVPIRNFLDEWARTLAHLYQSRFDPAQALAMGRQAVADYEGAILLARIYADPGYIEQVTQRALKALDQELEQ
nr:MULTISPECIES: TetR/AcrR family transcriptional regulator [unclassified Pseudomonas]